MKIAICICFSKKNEIHHHKIINNLNIIKIPKECNLSFYLVVNNNPTKLINLIKKIITNKKINIFILNSVKKDIPNTRNIFLLKIKNKNLDYVLSLNINVILSVVLNIIKLQILNIRNYIIY